METELGYLEMKFNGEVLWIDVAAAEPYKRSSSKARTALRNDVLVTDRQTQPSWVSTRCVHAFLARSGRGDIFPRQVFSTRAAIVACVPAFPCESGLTLPCYENATMNCAVDHRHMNGSLFQFCAPSMPRQRFQAHLNAEDVLSFTE